MSVAKRYKKLSVILTVVVHLALFLFFIISLSHHGIGSPAPASQPPESIQIVKAVTIDQSKVQSEINKIQAEKAAKEKAEVDKQKKLQKMASEAKKARQEEEKKVALLKTQQENLKKTQATEAKRLKAIREEQLAAKLEQEQQAKKTVEKKSEEKKNASPVTPAEVTNPSSNHSPAPLSANDLREIDRYKAMILNVMSQHWYMPKNMDKNLTTKLLVKLAPNGAVLNVTLARSSGNASLDQSAVAAVWKSSPLPMPVANPQLLERFRELSLTVRPEGFLT